MFVSDGHRFGFLLHLFILFKIVLIQKKSKFMLENEWMINPKAKISILLPSSSQTPETVMLAVWHLFF